MRRALLVVFALLAFVPDAHATPVNCGTNPATATIVKNTPRGVSRQCSTAGIDTVAMEATSGSVANVTHTTSTYSGTFTPTTGYTGPASVTVTVKNAAQEETVITYSY